MKRLLVFLSTLFLLVIIAGCGDTALTDGPSPTPTPYPTCSPTATPTQTPAPLTFRDLIELSKDEQVVLSTYPLITNHSCYGYEEMIHRLYLSNGTARLSIEMPQGEDKEIVFDSISHINFYDTQYHPDIISHIEMISSWGDEALYEEWNGYRELLESLDFAYILSLSEPYDVGFGITIINQVIIWQKDYTFYLLFTSPEGYTITTRSGIFEDDTFDNVDVNWDFMDLVSKSYDEAIHIDVTDYIRNSALSASHYLEMTIENGTISTTLPLTFNYVENYDLDFFEALYSGAYIESDALNKGIASAQYKLRLIDYIKTLPGCYLTTDCENNIAIFQVENTLYFLEIVSDTEGNNICWLIYAKTFNE